MGLGYVHNHSLQNIIEVAVESFTDDILSSLNRKHQHFQERLKERGRHGKRNRTR